MQNTMKFYEDLAHWWPLLSAPEEYAEEAGLYWNIITRYRRDIQDALELGSGGGNNAFHLKHKCDWMLTDISPAMIEVSRRLNPECEHLAGDMRTLDLNRTFDLVFIQDAVMFLTTREDLARALRVAHRHLERGGVLFVAPDFFRETFQPSTGHGGHDGPDRSLRYLEWTYDQDSADDQVEIEYVYLLKDQNGKVQSIHEQSVNGIFSRETWRALMTEAGFRVSFEPIEHSELAPGSYIGIVGIRE